MSRAKPKKPGRKPAPAPEPHNIQLWLPDACQTPSPRVRVWNRSPVDHDYAIAFERGDLPALEWIVDFLKSGDNVAASAAHLERSAKAGRAP